MKVGLIFFHSFLQPGGVKKHVLDLSRELKKRGVSVKIIVPRRKRSENYGKDVILLGSSFPMNFGGSQGHFCINFNPISLKRTLTREKFDILHFHNFGFPSVMQILTHSNSLNILTIHTNLDGSKFVKRFWPFPLINKMVGWRFDGILGVAFLNLKGLEKYTGPKAIIPNGVNLKEFNPGVPKLKKFLDGKLNLLFVGRMEKRKGLIYLLKAFKVLKKKFPQIRLIVVGDGKLREDCQKWAERHKLKDVCFEGQVPQEEIPSYFNTADIYISPAIFGESFGLVLLEAMACGTPVVAFANKGYKELLQGKKGEIFLAPPKNSRILAKKIELLIQDESLRKEMSEWGIAEAQKYSWSKIADQILTFYQLCKKIRT
ncbi:MAG: glycosyltransferase family 4 protein [bacterium]